MQPLVVCAWISFGVLCIGSLIITIYFARDKHGLLRVPALLSQFCFFPVVGAGRYLASYYYSDHAEIFALLFTLFEVYLFHATIEAAFLLDFLSDEPQRSADFRLIPSRTLKRCREKRACLMPLKRARPFLRALGFYQLLATNVLIGAINIKFGVDDKAVQMGLQGLFFLSFSAALWAVLNTLIMLDVTSAPARLNAKFWCFKICVVVLKIQDGVRRNFNQPSDPALSWLLPVFELVPIFGLFAFVFTSGSHAPIGLTARTRASPAVDEMLLSRLADGDEHIPSTYHLLLQAPNHHTHLTSPLPPARAARMLRQEEGFFVWHLFSCLVCCCFCPYRPEDEPDVNTSELRRSELGDECQIASHSQLESDRLVNETTL